MTQIGLWHITDNGPQKLKEGAVDLEQYLEDWIEHDPRFARFMVPYVLWADIRKMTHRFNG